MFVNIKIISIFAVTSLAGRMIFRKLFLPEKNTNQDADC